jgi:hypothetical protein
MAIYQLLGIELHRQVNHIACFHGAQCRHLSTFLLDISGACFPRRHYVMKVSCSQLVTKLLSLLNLQQSGRCSPQDLNMSIYLPSGIQVSHSICKWLLSRYLCAHKDTTNEIQYITAAYRKG